MLLLFFFSYAGPLSNAELRKVDENGFVQPIGSGRLSHTRNWPTEYADWADGQPRLIAKQKQATIMDPDVVESLEFTCCMENNWPEELHHPITHLIQASFKTFSNSAAATISRTEVSHARFIGTLDKWLDKYSDLEDKFSNCPFKQGMFRLSFLRDELCLPCFVFSSSLCGAES